ncbi:hypothetical protein RHMOL_Rhmol01G0170500 [Rhododendron molle]|uniref:Uncharacterized protein n=1 Tax=Rhododendron molle TaxID=49168 RepID=A0ACC0Q286_RHOML|nr:hypothetical protein RHMOL_Rhmol01G0170500 [Rhododendron molle]
MLEGSHSLALIYRIYYKCMKTNLNVHALVKSPKDKTVLIQISWNDIKLPSSWISENYSYPHRMQNDTIDLDYIKQYLDGTGRISFDQQRLNSPLKIKELNRSNSSVSIPRSDKNLLNSNTGLKDSKCDDEEASQGSPTPTDLDEITPNDSVSQQNVVHDSLMVLNKPAKNNTHISIDYDKLYNDYKSRKNKQKRKEYRNKYSSDQHDKLVARWEQYIEENNIEIYFFDWLKYFNDKPQNTEQKKTVLSSVCSTATPYLTFETPDQETQVVPTKATSRGDSTKKQLVKISQTSLQDLKHEANIVKKEIKKLKEPESDSCIRTGNSKDDQKEYYQKWYTTVKLIVKDYQIEVNALIDTGADLNCIQQGLVPTMYFHKTTALLSAANNTKMVIEYKLPKVHICQDNVCFKTTIVLAPDLTDRLILGTPFIC